MSTVRELREKLGFTQREFAEICGVTRQQYSNIEARRRKGSANFWLTLQKKFGLSNEKVLELLKN